MEDSQRPLRIVMPEPNEKKKGYEESSSDSDGGSSVWGGGKARKMYVDSIDNVADLLSEAEKSDNEKERKKVISFGTREDKN